jgi:hypothetical protein
MLLQQELRRAPELHNPLGSPELLGALEMLNPLQVLELLYSSVVGCLLPFCVRCCTNFPSNSLDSELSESSEDSESEDVPS